MLRHGRGAGAGRAGDHGAGQGRAEARDALQQDAARTRGRARDGGHAVRETYCDVCGYDLIRQTRDRTLQGPKP